MTAEPNGRNHEPDFRELVADLDGLRELMDARLAAVTEAHIAHDKVHAIETRELDRRSTAIESEVKTALQNVDRLASVHDQAHAREHSATQTAIDKAFDGSQRAVDKAEASQKERNHQQNEIRGQLDDQNKAFVLALSALLPRKEFDVQHSAIESDIEAIKRDIESLRLARAAQEATSSTALRYWGVVIVIAIAVVNAVVYLLGHK